MASCSAGPGLATSVVRDQVRASAELAEGGQRSCGELRGAGHLCSPSGCCVQCDAACRLAVALLGLIPGPPWTLQQLHNVRDMTDPQGRRRGPQVAHGTMTRWNEGCSFTRCRQAQNNAARVRGRARAQTVDDRGCAEVPQQTPSATGPAAAAHLCRRAEPR